MDKRKTIDILFKLAVNSVFYKPSGVGYQLSEIKWAGDWSNENWLRLENDRQALRQKR